MMPFRVYGCSTCMFLGVVRWVVRFLVRYFLIVLGLVV